MGQRAVSSNLRAVFKQLNDDVIALSWRWQIVSSLFESKERVELLRQTAPSFFGVCQITFLDDVFLALSRLTDPVQSSGQHNLVVDCLLDAIEQTTNPEIHKKEVRRLIKSAKESCLPLREHRNKRLAHNDLSIKLRFASEPLPGISVGDVNRAVKSLQSVMNAVSRHFFDSETTFKVVERGGVRTLITYLQKGVDAFEREATDAGGQGAHSSDRVG
jgi:hypothetical protein